MMTSGKKKRICDGLYFVTDSCVTSHVNENRISDTSAMMLAATSSAASMANGAGRRQTVNCDETYDELGSSPIVNAVNDAVMAAGTDGIL